jgi:hypothetical protein
MNPITQVLKSVSLSNFPPQFPRLTMQDYPAPRGINGVLNFGHKHVEAFAIMKYRQANPLKFVYVWNSRDGVTPFCIIIDGVEYNHTEFQNDKYAPHYQPQVGEYIFRDSTLEESRFFAEQRIEQYKDTQYYPKTEQERQDAITSMAEGNQGGPTLCVVESVSFTSSPVSK